MTNLESAKTIFNILHDDFFSWTPEVVEAFNMAIAALEKQEQTNTQSVNSTHTSRPNALESLNILEQAKDDKGSVPMSLVRQAFRNILEQGRWIPVTERLPEEREWIGTKHFGTTISDEVYVTFEAPSGERFAKHIMFQNGRLSSYDQRVVDTVFKGAKPIAWKPLPEPYKAEE